MMGFPPGRSPVTPGDRPAGESVAREARLLRGRLVGTAILVTSCVGAAVCGIVGWNVAAGVCVILAIVGTLVRAANEVAEWN